MDDKSPALKQEFLWTSKNEWWIHQRWGTSTSRIPAATACIWCPIIAAAMSAYWKSTPPCIPAACFFLAGLRCLALGNWEETLDVFTVDGSEIRLTWDGAKSHRKWWDIYHINWLAEFLNHQQYHFPGPFTHLLKPLNPPFFLRLKSAYRSAGGSQGSFSHGFAIGIDEKNGPCHENDWKTSFCGKNFIHCSLGMFRPWKHKVLGETHAEHSLWHRYFWTDPFMDINSDHGTGIYDLSLTAAQVTLWWCTYRKSLKKNDRTAQPNWWA